MAETTNAPEKTKVSVEDIVNGVISRIQSGDFLPGKPVREAELCEIFGVSRTPVREALRLLQNNGVVEYIPRCGVQVVELTEETLDYITDTRTVLEVLSTRTAAQKITPEQVQELRELNRRFLDYEHEDSTALDGQLHLRIAEISGNPCVLEYLKNLIMRQALTRSTMPMQPKRIKLSYREHEAIILALELNDPELAARQAETHFYMSQKSLQHKLDVYIHSKQNCR